MNPIMVVGKREEIDHLKYIELTGDVLDALLQKINRTLGKNTPPKTRRIND